MKKEGQAAPRTPVYWVGQKSLHHQGQCLQLSVQGIHIAVGFINSARGIQGGFPGNAVAMLGDKQPNDLGGLEPIQIASFQQLPAKPCHFSCCEFIFHRSPLISILCESGLTKCCYQKSLLDRQCASILPDPNTGY